MGITVYGYLCFARGHRRIASPEFDQGRPTQLFDSHSSKHDIVRGFVVMELLVVSVGGGWLSSGTGGKPIVNK